MTARLDDYGDVLTVDELASVLGTSRRTIFRQRRAGTFPIPEVPGIDAKVRYAKVVIAAFLARQPLNSLRNRRQQTPDRQQLGAVARVHAADSGKAVDGNPLHNLVNGAAR